MKRYTCAGSQFRKRYAPDYEKLETRELLTGVSLENIAGRMTIVIDGSSQDDVAMVQDGPGGLVEFSLNNSTSQYARTSFERIRFLGRSGNDTFVNTTDIASAAFGHSGNDSLTGGNGNNWMQGGDGNDTLTGGSRNDALRGNAGNDVLLGGQRHDRIFGGTGDDEIRGQQGNDFTNGEGGADLLIGGSGNDRLLGESGADTIFGGTGDDRAHGGAGHDQINLDDGIDAALFDHAFEMYSISGSSSSLVVSANTGLEARDTVNAAENLRFADGPRPAAPTTSNLNEAEQASFTRLNNLRSNQNVGALSAVNDLNEFARNWSLEMSRTGFRHSTLAQRAHLLVGSRTTTTENIAFSPDATMTADEAAETFHRIWQDSSFHFANMTDADKTEVGVGFVQTSAGWFATLVFADG